MNDLLSHFNNNSNSESEQQYHKNIVDGEMRGLRCSNYCYMKTVCGNNRLMELIQCC
jgi:hypothetical protein